MSDTLGMGGYITIEQAEFATDGSPFPGLFNATVSDGDGTRTLFDLTMGQVVSIARKQRLEIRQASGGRA